MKRGASGLSLLVGVNKPSGMSSHDVVNRVRSIFSERRVGHTGTLDPLASGVLPVCVGPATRLDAYLVGHDKRYRVEMRFGFETTTDDGEGESINAAPLIPQVRDEGFAASRVLGLVGEHEQVPPQYSAIKVNGKRAYQLARAGRDAQLAARTVRVHKARLIGLKDDDEGMPTWEFEVLVSKGTYIRSLVRDLGRAVGCPAHLKALERTQAGAIQLAECYRLDTLETLGEDAALDPVAVLGFRFAFADGCGAAVSSGARLRGDALELAEPVSAHRAPACACTTDWCPSTRPPEPGELASLVVGNRLKAIYQYSEQTDAWKPSCVFSTGISRG